jgi:uncharacterized membrane protein YjgN (DUF898 family)
MLELIATLLVFLLIIVLGVLVVTGLFIFIGTISGMDIDTFHEDEE